MNYKYPHQKICGIWLITVAFAIWSLLLPLKGISYYVPNPIFFGIIFILGMIWQLNKRTEKRLAIGKETKRQQLFSNLSVVVSIVLIIIIFNLIKFMNGGVWAQQSTSIMWASCFLVIGLHFLGFIPVHGKMMIILSLLTVIISLFCLFNLVSLKTLFIVDGLIKLLCGIIMIYISPTNF